MALTSMAHISPLYQILVISDYRSVISSRPEAEIFIRLARLGHSITILSYPEATLYNARFREAGIRVLENHPQKKYSRAYILWLRKLIQENEFDAVHVFNTKGLVNAIWALQGLKPRLIAYRGYAGQTPWYDPTMYLKYFHPRVDFILCVSEEVRRSLAKNMLRADKKLVVLAKGHDPAWYQAILPTDRSLFGFTKKDVLLCFLANVRPFKGLPYVIQATHLLQPNSSLHLICIGSGYDKKNIQELLKQSPMQKQIHVLGYRTDALSVLAMCDGLIQASTHGEGLSKSVIEAMSLGKPPIITDIPANHGFVVPGESGWIVPAKNTEALAQAIEDFVSNPDERKRRGELAQKRIRAQFNIEKTVSSLLEFYATRLK